MNQVFIARNGIRVYTQMFRTVADAVTVFEQMSSVEQSTYTVHIIIEKKEGLK